MPLVRKAHTQVSTEALEAEIKATVADAAEGRKQEFSVFYSRLTTAAEAAGKDPLKWAAEHGVAEQSIRNLRTEQKPPGLTILRRLSKASGKTINWWLGEDDPVNTDEFVFIERYATDPSAPALTMAFRRYWIDKYMKVSADKLLVYRVEDDAMSDTLVPHDNVLIDSSAPGTLKDGLYALLINGALMIRRIQVLPLNKIRVMPDNPKYPAFEVELGEDSGVEIYGTPRWYSRLI